MKITSATAYTVDNPSVTRGGRYWYLVKLETDEGVIGWGEVYWYTYGPEAYAHTIRDIAEHFFVDRDPFQVETIFQSFFYYHSKQHSDLGKMGVFSGFEVACWDIIGQDLGKPIHALLGGRCRERIRAYSYLYYPEHDRWMEPMWTDPDQVGEAALEFVKMGFTAIKFDPVPSSSMPPPPWIPPLVSYERSEACLASIRESVGTSCDIIVGTHGQFTPSAAIRFAKRIKRFDPLWFEEPVPPEVAGGLARVVAASEVPVATGERLATIFEYVSILQAGVDICQIDVAGVGGIFQGRKVAAMAEAFHAQVTTHCYSGPVNFAAQLQLAACCPNFLIQEAVGVMDGIHSELLDEGFRWENGYFVPSESPGLGISVNEDAVKAHAVDRFVETDPLLKF